MHLVEEEEKLVKHARHPPRCPQLSYSIRCLPNTLTQKCKKTLLQEKEKSTPNRMGCSPVSLSPPQSLSRLCRTGKRVKSEEPTATYRSALMLVDHLMIGILDELIYAVTGSCHKQIVFLVEFDGSGQYFEGYVSVLLKVVLLAKHNTQIYILSYKVHQQASRSP